MHDFRYRDGELFCEQTAIREIVRRVGTPCYIYSSATLASHFRAFDRAFASLPRLICFALKANSNAAVLRLLGKEGAGADVVSGGELFRALRAGISPEKIVYAGVGKRRDEIEYALKMGIRMFNVESGDELHAINEAAGEMRARAPIALRVNPDIDPRTHAYISTGMRENKFGIPLEEALEYYRIARDLPHIEIVGIHQHIGSQITEVRPFVDALVKVTGFVRELANAGIAVKHIDIGGGLGITYKDETPPLPDDLAKAVSPLFAGSGCSLVLEPGRAIVGNAGILVTSVLYRKDTSEKRFAIVDAGMNDLIRPSLYEAYHEIKPVVEPTSSEQAAFDVVGPICESGDFLAKDRLLPIPGRGDLLAVMSAGAYGFSMASNYNSRPRAAEVMVKGNQYSIIRERETVEDLLRGEKVPRWLNG